MHNRIRTLNQQIHANVSRCGWHATGVGPGDGLPRLTYSTGFALLDGHPEILIPVLPFQVAHAFLAQLYQGIVQAGIRRSAGVAYDDIAANYPSQFVAVAPEWQERLLTMTQGYYMVYHGRRPFTTIQLVIPDRYGRWPWEPGNTLDQPLFDRMPIPPDEK